MNTMTIKYTKELIHTQMLVHSVLKRGAHATMVITPYNTKPSPELIAEIRVNTHFHLAEKEHDFF